MATQATQGWPDSFDVYVSQNIGTIKLGDYGMSPIRAMLDLVGRHSECLTAGEHSEYHATILGQSVTVVVALDPEPEP